MTGNYGRVRVLNASTGYQPFNVALGGWMIASQLGNGDITSYIQAAAGSRTMTVSGANGYIYIQKSITIRPPNRSIRFCPFSSGVTENAGRFSCSMDCSTS